MLNEDQFDLPERVTGIGELSEDERNTLLHTAQYTAGDHQDLRYYQDFTKAQRDAGQARWNQIADWLNPATS